MIPPVEMSWQKFWTSILCNTVASTSYYMLLISYGNYSNCTGHLVLHALGTHAVNHAFSHEGHVVTGLSQNTCPFLLHGKLKCMFSLILEAFSHLVSVVWFSVAPSFLVQQRPSIPRCTARRTTLLDGNLCDQRSTTFLRWSNSPCRCSTTLLLASNSSLLKIWRLWRALPGFVP